jgi:hypothetical protein
MADLDYYESYSGLSQDEFKRFIKLRKEFHNKEYDMPQLEKGELWFMVECLEAIAEGRANKIEELEQELTDTYFVPND